MRKWPLVCLLVVVALVQGGAAPAREGEVTIGKYTYFTNTTTSPYIDYRPTSVTGVVTAIDLSARRIMLQPIYTDRVHNQDSGQPFGLQLAKNCQFFVDNLLHDLAMLKTGDIVHAWLEGVGVIPASPSFPDETQPINRMAQSLYLLRGANISDKWFPDILLKPNENGMVFFDDFESGDLRKWHYRTGCAGILKRGALDGRFSFTSMRPIQEGRAMDYLYLYGLPQMDDVWMKWTFQYTGEPADTGNFAIFRVFPETGAQVFAVRIEAPTMSSDGKWHLACQLAQANAIPGTISLEPGKVHVMKLHWKKTSSAENHDGTIETWIDGRKDLDLVGNASTWAEELQTGRERKMARLAMGVMHTGVKRFGATIVIDDLWIGDRDPDQTPSSSIGTTSAPSHHSSVTGAYPYMVALSSSATEIADEPTSTAKMSGLVEVKVSEEVTGAPLPCRLTVVDADGKLAPIEPEKAPWIASRPGVLYTGTGEARFSLASGRYTLYANRGFEYSLVKRDFNVLERTTRINLRLQREVDTDGYVSCDPHIHTAPFSKDSSCSVQERLATIVGEGIELAIATDHNHQTDFSLYQEATPFEGGFTPVIGNEITTPAGHMNAFPIDSGSPIPEYRSTDWLVVLDSVRNTPGVKVVMLNHPSNDHNNFIPTDPRRFHPASGESHDGRIWSFDALEVVTSAAMQSDWMKPYRDWFALLNRGHRITSMGSSDTHDVNRYILGQARTYVASRAQATDQIDVSEACDSILNGRTLVSMGLLAEAWVMDHGIGDKVSLGGKQSWVRVRVQGPRWIEADRVDVYLNGQLAISTAIEHRKYSVVKFDESLQLPDLSHDAWLVVIASGPGIKEPYWPTPRPHKPLRASWEPRVFGSTNPIWLDCDGDGRFSSPYDYARQLVAEHKNEPEILTRKLSSLDSATAVQVASLLTQEGVGLSTAVWRRAIDNSEPHVRHGFVVFINLLKLRNDK